MRTIRLLLVSGALCLWFGAAQAQQAGNTTAAPPASGVRGGMGMGPHMGGGPMGMRGGPGDTAGWSLMTPEERRQHHAKMMSFTRAKDCRAYVDQHHRLMVERASQRGVAIPAKPMHDPCDGLKD